MGLPENWLGCNLNDVTRIKNKCGKRELDQIGEKLSQIELKIMILIKS